MPYSGNIVNRANAAINNWLMAPIGNLAIGAVDAVANPGWTLYNAKDFLVNSFTAFGKWSENNPDRIAGVSAALTSAMTYAKDNLTNPDAHLQVATMGWGVFGGSLIGSKINLSKDFTLKSSKVAESVSSPYEGVRAASKYLQEQGVPRGYRKQILQSFEVETISLKVADNATFGLRFYGGAASQSGRYIFPTFTNYTNRIGLALPPRWNSMSGMSQFQVAPGSTYIFGRAASQGGIYTGGSFQMYINNLNDLYKLH